MAELPPIIIADDDPDDAFLLARRFRDAGIENPLLSFRDAGETVAFLEVVLRNRDEHVMPCALFADLKLPGATGLELIRWVKSRPALGELRVFVMTGLEDPEYRRRAEAMEVDGFAVKFPCTEELRAMLATTSSQPQSAY